MKIWRELLGYVKLIVIVVAITLVINNVVLINAKIPSPSMEKCRPRSGPGPGWD